MANNEVAMLNVPRSCHVCGVPVTRKSLDLDVCRACVEFFRRAIHEHKQNRCKQAKRCDVNVRKNVHGRIPCAYCRFIRCLRAGLDADDIPTPREPSSSSAEGSMLGRLAMFRRSLFISRFKMLMTRGLALEPSQNVNVSRTRFAANNMVNLTVSIETDLLKDYFSHYDIIDYFVDGWNPGSLAQHFFPVWTVFEYLQAVARNRGYDRRTCTYPTICHRPSSRRVWKTSGGHMRTVKLTFRLWPTRLLYETFTNLLPFAKAFKQASLDEFEVAALFQLIIAHYARNAFATRTSRKNFVETTLKDLIAYYRGSNHFVTRMDRIAGLLAEYNKAYDLYRHSQIAFSLMAPKRTFAMASDSHCAWCADAQPGVPCRHCCISFSQLYYAPD
ncbi:zinc finger protein [Aphelenchoides avenae]|nr:zinc finger protein [Aphelenchus avenae]